MKLFLLIFLFPVLVYSQSQENNLNSSEDIHKQLVELKNLKPDEFDKKIDDFRGSVERYIEKKKRVCNGEFTTIILNDEAKVSETQVKKLSKEEKQLCFNELKAIYKTYINHLFVVRSRFLEYLNKKRIEELASIRDETLKSIDSTFGRNK